jgi:hypothetical protein
VSDFLVLALLCALVTWRVASLLHTEDAFEWLRRWIGIENDERGYPTIYPQNFLGKLFHCFWCLSLVVSVPVTALVVYLSGTALPWAPLLWLSASTIAIWIERQVLRSQSR